MSTSMLRVCVLCTAYVTAALGLFAADWSKLQTLMNMSAYFALLEHIPSKPLT